MNQEITLMMQMMQIMQEQNKQTNELLVKVLSINPGNPVSVNVKKNNAVNDTEVPEFNIDEVHQINVNRFINQKSLKFAVYFKQKDKRSPKYRIEKNNQQIKNGYNDVTTNKLIGRYIYDQVELPEWAEPAMNLIDLDGDPSVVKFHDEYRKVDHNIILLAREKDCLMTLLINTDVEILMMTTNDMSKDNNNKNIHYIYFNRNDFVRIKKN